MIFRIIPRTTNGLQLTRLIIYLALLVAASFAATDLSVCRASPATCSTTKCKSHSRANGLCPLARCRDGCFVQNPCQYSCMNKDLYGCSSFGGVLPPPEYFRWIQVSRAGRQSQAKILPRPTGRPRSLNNELNSSEEVLPPRLKSPKETPPPLPKITSPPIPEEEVGSLNSRKDARPSQLSVAHYSDSLKQHRTNWDLSIEFPHSVRETTVYARKQTTLSAVERVADQGGCRDPKQTERRATLDIHEAFTRDQGTVKRTHVPMDRPQVRTPMSPREPTFSVRDRDIDRGLRVTSQHYGRSLTLQKAERVRHQIESTCQQDAVQTPMTSNSNQNRNVVLPVGYTRTNEKHYGIEGREQDTTRSTFRIISTP